MKVTLLTSLSGSQGSFVPGEEYECSAAEGKRLVAKGLAEVKKRNSTRKETTSVTLSDETTSL